MPETHDYITFYRSKLRFLNVFFSFIMLGGIIFGFTEGFTRSFLLILLCILLILVFLYEFYLVSSPIVEIIHDSMTIRQIYHPIFKWSFIYQTHIIGFTDVLTLKIGLDGKDQASLLQIQYRDGIRVKNCYLRRSDVSDFGSVIKLLEDRLPDLVVNYVKG